MSAKSPISPQKSVSPGGTAAITMNNIRAQNKRDLGIFKMTKDLCGWRNSSTKKVVQYECRHIQSCIWSQVGRLEYALMLLFVDGRVETFVGFVERDYEKVRRHLQSVCNIPLEKQRKSVRGWHWGEYEFWGKSMIMNVDEKPAFRINGADVSQVTQVNKTDISLRLRMDDDRLQDQDQVEEIRFYVPPPKDNERDSQESIEKFKENLLQIAGMSEAKASGVIAILPYALLRSPPGRFDIQIMRDQLRLHGKTADFSVPFKTISQIYILPAKPLIHVMLNLEAPLRRGQTSYSQVVIQFDEKKVIDMPLTLSDEDLEELKKRNPDIKRTISGSEVDVFSNIFLALVQKPVISPDEFVSFQGLPYVRCANKALGGALYLLKDMVVFVPKPVIIVRYEDILAVDFGNTGGNQTKYYEFRIAVKNKSELEFSSVDRQEYNCIVNWFVRKGCRVRSSKMEENASEGTFLDQNLPTDSESDDEDFQDEGDDNDEDDDSVDSADEEED